MAEISQMDKVKSPQEIEEGIKSIKTVTWEPFTVLPKEIYLEIFEKLDNSADKQNFMNAHPKFYDLYKSNRILFLYQQVFKKLAKIEENLHKYNIDDEHDTPVLKYYLHCRLVCRDWDTGTQNFFQSHETYFKLEGQKRFFSYSEFPSYYQPCKTFTWFNSSEAEKDFEMFLVTHPPSKNPFLSRTIALLPFFDMEEVDFEEEVDDIVRYRASLDSLVERYGQHIWHCKIRMTEKLNPEAILLIVKWLELMPELKTLELKYVDVEAIGGCSENEIREIKEMQLMLPELKNLVFFKSSPLPPVIFNKIFGKFKGLETIWIELCKKEHLRDFEISGRDNLKEAYFQIKGLEDYEYLGSSEGFPSLKKLVMRLEFETEAKENNWAYLRWPEWKRIFKVLEEKFAALEDLTIHLPKAVTGEDKGSAIKQSLECQLNLPNLKRLWVILPNLCSLDFLRPCKALKRLRVNLVHSEWNRKTSKELKRIRRKEKLNFNMDLRDMWESNIWKAFPKLKRLKVLAKYESESTSLTNRYIYEKYEEERKYFQWTDAERQAVVNYDMRLAIENQIFSDPD